MAINIINSLADYVSHIEAIEASPQDTCVASSFLSSHLFSKSAFLRFFQQEIPNETECQKSSEELWMRAKKVRANIKRVSYREVYEMDAFKEFCYSGIVHRQTPNFRSTPKEILLVLDQMLNLLRECPKYEIAFCREVLPFVFIVKKEYCVTIDVRNNFGYQRIQGLVIDDTKATARFYQEFERVWQDQGTISKKEEVISLIKTKREMIADGSVFLVRQ